MGQMTFLDWLVQSLVKMACALVATVALLGAAAIAFLKLLEDLLR